MRLTEAAPRGTWQQKPMATSGRVLCSGYTLKEVTTLRRLPDICWSITPCFLRFIVISGQIPKTFNWQRPNKISLFLLDHCFSHICCLHMTSLTLFKLLPDWKNDFPTPPSEMSRVLVEHLTSFTTDGGPTSPAWTVRWIPERTASCQTESITGIVSGRAKQLDLPSVIPQHRLSASSVIWTASWQTLAFLCFIRDKQHVQPDKHSTACLLHCSGDAKQERRELPCYCPSPSEAGLILEFVSAGQKLTKINPQY